MLKNKKILVILFAFLFLIFIKTDCFATYDYSESDFLSYITDEYKTYKYFCGLYFENSSGGVYYYYFSNKPFEVKEYLSNYWLYSSDTVYCCTVGVSGNYDYDFTLSETYEKDTSITRGYNVSYSNFPIYYASGEKESGIFFQQRS